MNLIKRIEVIRGPASALYGSNGIFATINVVTFSPSEYSGTRVRVEGSSLGEKKLQATSSVAVGRGAKLLFSASGLSDRGVHSIYVPEYDSPETNFGRAVGVDGEQGYHVFGDLTWGDWNVSALFGGRDKNQIISWGPTVFNDPAPIRKTRRILSTRPTPIRRLPDETRSGEPITAVIAFGTFHISRAASRSIARYSPRLAGSQLNYRGVAAHRPLTLGTMGQWMRALQRSIVSPVSEELQHRQTRSVRRRVCPGRVESEFALGVEHGRALRLLAIRRNSSPRALIHQPPRRRPAWYGKAFRIRPPRVVLYDLSAWTRESRRASGRGQHIRVGRRTPLGSRMNVIVSAYRYAIDGLLVGQYTDAGLLQYSNAEAVRASGLEVELNGNPARWLELVASIAIQRAAQGDQGLRLPNSPGQVAKLRAVVPIFRTGLSLASSVQFMSERQTLAGATLKDVVLSDIVVSSNRLTQNLDFQLGVRNLGNVEYRNPLALNSRVDSLSATGRSFFATFTWGTRGR